MPKTKRTKEDIAKDINEQRKTCCVCNIRKDFSDFFNLKNKSDGKSYRCKSCDNIAKSNWRKNNLYSAQMSVRRNNLKSKYGIDLEDYLSMLKKQNYKCAICNTESNSVRGKTRLWNFAVDHDHDTGKVRGILCNQCNRALGMFGDDSKTLRKAAKYLEKHGK